MAKLDKIEESVIVGVKTGTGGVIKDLHGMYVYPTTIRSAEKKDPGALQIRFARVNKFHAIKEEDDEEEKTNADLQ